MSSQSIVAGSSSINQPNEDIPSNVRLMLVRCDEIRMQQKIERLKKEELRLLRRINLSSNKTKEI